MAIGRPIQLTGNVASKTIRVLATEGQTVFTVNGGYRINQISVFRNGIRLSPMSDFTALDGTSVTLVNAASLNDEVLFQVQDDFRVSDAIVSAASSQTIDGDVNITGNLFFADGSGGIVTSITAGDNISVSSPTGNVTITGLASTDVIVADSLLVQGISTFSNTTLINGNTKLNFNSNSGQEGQLYATSEYFYINSSASNGVFVQSDGFIELKQGSGSDKYIEMNSHPNHNGEVSLYYNGNKKLETTGAGVTITGICSATSFSGDGSALTGISAGSAVSDDTTTNSDMYPVFSSSTSGTLTAKVSSTKLTYNPSTGKLTSTIVNSSSDENLKKDISTITDALDKVKQLRGVDFTWKDNGTKGKGVIAQELQQVFPELVSEEPDGNLSVNYTGLIAVLIEAIKDLSDS